VSFERTEAIVLRKVDFSETSRIVTFLTPYRGRLACMVKGARRKGSPLAALLDTYNHLEITYAHKENRNIQLMTEAVLLNGYGAIKANVEHIACAAFLLETAGLAAQENNPAPELFQATCEGLERLAAEADNPFMPLVSSIYEILEASGYAPDTEEITFANYTRSLTHSEKKMLAETIEIVASGEPLAENNRAFLVLRFLHDYGQHHFEKPMKSYAFLKSFMGTQR